MSTCIFTLHPEESVLLQSIRPFLGGCKQLAMASDSKMQLAVIILESGNALGLFQSCRQAAEVPASHSL